MTVIVAFMLAFSAGTIQSATYSGQVGNMLSNYLDDAGNPRNCMLFMVGSHGAWLALHKDHPDYEGVQKQILLARAMSWSINAYTTGANAPGNCAWEEINFVGYF